MQGIFCNRSVGLIVGVKFPRAIRLNRPITKETLNRLWPHLMLMVSFGFVSPDFDFVPRFCNLGMIAWI